MKKYFQIFTIIAIFCVDFPLSAQKADSVKYTNLDPYYFHLNYLKDDTAMLIDVREFFEFKRSRIKDAVNIPSSGNLDFASDTLNRNLALFLYCTTDFRSIRVAAKFAEKGFRKVNNLTGGMKAWKEDGYPLEKKKLKGTAAQRRKG
jgi:phage shock protein E